jgi:hypothetical protein
MNTQTTTGASRVPRHTEAVYKAAELIYNDGPKTRAELFRAVDFADRKRRFEKLARAIHSDWLVELPGALIGITDFAREHFDDDEQSTPAYVGQVAGPRDMNLMQRPAYKSQLNPRGFRDDVPPSSVRSGQSFFTKA